MSEEEDEDDLYNLDDDSDEEGDKTPQNIEITYSDDEKAGTYEDDDDEDEEDDEVERIVDRRVQPSGSIDYKVHWKGTDSDTDEWFSRPKLLSMYTNMVVEYEENHRLLATPVNQFKRSIMPSPSSVPRLSISRPVTPVAKIEEKEKEEEKEIKHENISAGIIQHKYKEYRQKKRLKLEQHLAEQIYIAYRNNKLILAIIKIQSFFRKCLASVILNQLKEEKEKEKRMKELEELERREEENAIKPNPLRFPRPESEITSFNSFRVIEEALNVPEDIKKAVKLIQKVYRIHKYHIKSLEQIIDDRIKKRQEKNKRKLNKEKLKIQLFISKHFRGRKIRKLFKKRVEMVKMIQLFLSKHYKGRKVRKEFKIRLEKMKIIQLWVSKHYRGNKQRKAYKLIKDMNEEEFNNKTKNSILIQKHTRGYINRKKYLKIKKSIVIIQSLIRMYINKCKYKTIRKNTIKIQKFLHSKYNNKKQYKMRICKEILENDILYNRVYNEIDIDTKEKVILFIQKHYRGKRDRLYFRKLKHILILLNELKYMKKASLNQDIFNNNNNKMNIIKQRNNKDRIYFQCYCIPNKKCNKGIIDIWTCSLHQKVFLAEIYEYINNNHINIDYNKCGSMISFLFENVTSNITVTEQNCDIFYMWDFPVRFPIHYTIDNNSNNLYEEIRISVYVLGVFYCILNVKIPTKFNQCNNNNNKLNYYKIRTTITYVIPEQHLHNNNNLAVLLIDDSIISPTNPIINQTINQLKDREYGIYILSNKLITNYSIEIICKLYLNLLSIKWNQLFVLSLLLVEKQIIGPTVENPIYEPPENNYILTYNDHRNNNNNNSYRNSFTTLSTESISSVSSSTVTSDNSNNNNFNNISKIEVSKFLKLFHSIPANYILVYIPQLSFNIFIPSNFDNYNNNNSNNCYSEYMQIISSILTPSKFLQIFNQTLSTLKERMSIEMFASKLNKMNNNSTFMKNVLKSMILVRMKELFVFEPTEYSLNNNYNDESNLRINELIMKYKNYEYQVRLIQKWFIKRIEYKYKVNTKRINSYKRIIKESTISLKNTKPKLQKSMNYLIHTNRILKYRNIKHISPQQLENEINSFNNNNNNNNNRNDYNDVKIYEDKIEKQNKEIRELKSQLDSLKKEIFEKEKKKEKSPSEEENEENDDYDEKEQQQVDNNSIKYKPTPPPQKPQLFKYTHIFTPSPDPDDETSSSSSYSYSRQYINNYNNNNNICNRRNIKPTPPPLSSSKKRHSSASSSVVSHRSVRRSLF